MVVAFEGWMDGGDVSTGTVRYIVDTLEAKEIAHIEPQGFYIYSFPGSMEVSAMFRPHTRIENGLIQEFSPPENTFYVVPDRNLVLFIGKEPNLEWDAFADYMFEMIEKLKIKKVFFIGSVAGATPHTREPNMTCSASTEELRDEMKRLGVRITDYEGPAHFVTYLMLRAADVHLQMAGLVAEIPAYVQGYNPRSIETTVKLLARLLNMKIDITELREASQVYIDKISELVDDQPELAEKVKELEANYDKEAFDKMTNLKDWLGQQGIKLD